MIIDIHSFYNSDRLSRCELEEKQTRDRRRHGELSEEIRWRELRERGSGVPDQELATLKAELERITNSNYWASLILEQMKMPRGD